MTGTLVGGLAWNESQPANPEKFAWKYKNSNQIIIKFILLMRITIEIDEEKIREIIQKTRQKKMSPALVQALDEFLENRRRREFLAKVMEGKTDYAATNEEIEDLSHMGR